MKFIPTDLPGVILIEPDVFKDDRGFFYESYHQRKFTEGGLGAAFVQDNHSRSTKGTLRGLHMQLKNPQGKLVRTLVGEIFDVAVDLRIGSPTFGKWAGVTLSDTNFRQLYVPPGFAHGFVVTSDSADVLYKCTTLYDKTDEAALIWNDPDVNVHWPTTSPILSAKDQLAPRLHQLKERLAAFPAYHA